MGKLVAFFVCIFALVLVGSASACPVALQQAVLAAPVYAQPVCGLAQVQITPSYAVAAPVYAVQPQQVVVLQQQQAHHGRQRSFSQRSVQRTVIRQSSR
jgi:hypothetical protein